MVNWPGKLKYTDAIYAINNNKAREKTKKTIHVISRVSQTFFSLGCAFSILGMYSHLIPLMAGGSFFFHGSIIVLRALEAILCHDLAKLSANVASIFKSTVIADFAKYRIGNPAFGSAAAWTINKIEDYSDLPTEIKKNLNKPKDISIALTHDTISLHLLDQEIEKALNTNI